MKWLVIIIVLIVLIALVGALWLRTVRKGPDTVPARSSHRLDESVTPPTLGLRPDAPSTAEGSVFGGGGTRDVPAEPGSDFAREPGITEPEGTEPGSDPQPPGARPEA
jgi:hypothetical protein